jgi:hypothetical protein
MAMLDNGVNLGCKPNLIKGSNGVNRNYAFINKSPL